MLVQRLRPNTDDDDETPIGNWESISGNLRKPMWSNRTVREMRGCSENFPITGMGGLAPFKLVHIDTYLKILQNIEYLPC